MGMKFKGNYLEFLKRISHLCLWLLLLRQMVLVRGVFPTGIIWDLDSFTWRVVVCIFFFYLISSDEVPGSFYILLILAALGLKSKVLDRSVYFDLLVDSLAFALRNPEHKSPCVFISCIFLNLKQILPCPHLWLLSWSLQ